MGNPNLQGFYRDGLFRRKVVVVSTALGTSGTTAARQNILPEDSGTIFMFGVATTASAGLPKISSKWLGLTYDFYFSTAANTADYTVQCPDDSSAGIYLALSSAGVGTPTTITPGSTDVPHGIRVTAISSIIWLGEPLMVNGASTHNSTAASVGVGQWTTE
jgi:hypothetical protein